MAIGSKRKRYVYVDDTSSSWTIDIADDRVINVTPATGLVLYDPTNPPANFKGRLNPRYCRRVYAQGTIASGSEAGTVVRRQFICNLLSPLYASNLTQEVAYQPADATASIPLSSTSRKGEKIVF